MENSTTAPALHVGVYEGFSGIYLEVYGELHECPGTGLRLLRGLLRGSLGVLGNGLQGGTYRGV